MTVVCALCAKTARFYGDGAAERALVWREDGGHDCEGET